MQVPEKLALIGGSVLLSSLLAFTLKGQVANLLPRTASPIQNIDTQASTMPSMVQFHDGYRQAQKNGWQIGKWGEVPYYIDNSHNMYLGSGDLQVDHLRNVIGGDQADSLVTLNIEGHVRTSGNTFLFSTSTDGNYRNSNLTTINGIENVEFSNNTLGNTFASDTSLRNMDLAHLNIGHINDLYDTFNNTPSLHATTHWNLDGKNLFYTFSNSGIHNEP